MGNKTPKRFPELPKQFKDEEDIRVYLQELLRELTSYSESVIEGPINTTPFVPVNFAYTRNLDAATATTADVARVLCTLIFTLKQGGLIK